MFERIPHEDTATFISPMPTQLVFGHVTLLNDQEAFLQGVDGGMESSSEQYDKPQQLTAKALLADFLETLSSSETLLAWRVGFILGEMIGLLHPDLDTQDASLSYLEALEQQCQRRTC